MLPEEIFGVNAGKVWHALNSNNKAMSVKELTKVTKLKKEEVYGALGWLGREGKIQIVKEGNALKFRLV